jgi:hypothetical protein
MPCRLVEICPEGGGNKCLLNVGKFLKYYTTACPSRQQCPIPQENLKSENEEL